MIRFPACKINLGLHILEKRADSYHNLETVFHPVHIHDALEILPLSNEAKPQLSLSGLPVSGDENSNLCIKAWQMVKRDFPQLPSVNIHLHKAVPMGAGLGGGSADGAAALMMLNDMFNLQLSSESLARYALQLGSDCPFFIYNKPLFATGRGETFLPVNINLNGCYFYIVNPNIHINTGEAFSQLKYVNHASSLLKIIEQPIEIWRNILVNDFEEGIVKMHPVVADVKRRLYRHGAVYAAMSGSGSTVFGIFKKQPQLLSFPASFFTKILEADVAI